MLAQLSDFVTQEAEAIRRTFQELWRLPIIDRVVSGRCIEGLEFASIKKDRFLCLRCTAENHSDFREGDMIRLSKEDPLLPVLKGSLHRVEDTEIWIEPGASLARAAEEVKQGSWLLDRDYLDLEDFYRRALKELGETVRGRDKILPLLAGQLAPSVDLERFGEAAEKAEKENVNEAQSEAIAQGVATNLCHLVQGPPGTGKTFVLAQIVKQRVARGERVLITAATHRAIHNALGMIRRIAPEIDDIVKIGPEIYDPELDVCQYENFSASKLDECTGGYVVGATPFAARSKRLRGVEFDAVIIDEAGQVTLPLAVMAMLSAEAYVLIGDHRQLPPVVQSLRPGNAQAASVFGHLSGRGFETMLDLTYRMNSELASWPSRTFYQDKLRPTPQNAGRRLSLPEAPRKFEDILDQAQPLVFVELKHATAHRFSDEEALLTADLLEELHRSGVPLAEVAVIVPFRRQARRVRHFLAAKGSIPAQELFSCVIDTVERMQGQEREVVILSMTASHPEYLAKVREFLLLPQRLNVAVTRARSKAIILASEQIGSEDALATDDPELVELWNSLRDACHVVR